MKILDWEKIVIENKKTVTNKIKNDFINIDLLIFYYGLSFRTKRPPACEAGSEDPGSKEIELFTNLFNNR